ncbi:hypothetical protein [Fluviicola taffensis]|uniref:hypothetical protein n=1 Tax=Fluviicola taffensis TaxID=191579 RepID=UPI003137BA17
MKDDKEHIDQLFESLNDRQFDIPEAFLEDLNKRLDNNNNEPKKRRRFLLWFLLPVVSLGAIAVIYFQSFDSSKVTTPSNLANKTIAKEEYKEDLKAEDIILLSEPDQKNQSRVDSVSTPTTDKNLSAVKQSQVEKKQVKASEKGTNQTNSSKQIDLNQRTFKAKKNQTGQLSLSKKGKSEKGKSPTAIHADKQTKQAKSQANGTLQKPVNSKTPSSKKKDQNSLNPGVDEKKIQEKIAPASIPDPAVNTSSTAKPDDKELSKESVPEKETDSAITQNAVDTTQQANSSQPEKEGTTPKSATDKWKKEIKLFAGLGANRMQDSPKNSEYLAKIKENQSSILAPSFGVSANLSYKKFTFGTGLTYEQTGEKFKVDLKNSELKDSTYSQLVQDTIWVQDTSGWIPILHDTTLYFTVQYMDTSLTSRSFQNRYSWISIPLHFGYRFELGKYELIPRLGAAFNFGIAQKRGTYPNASFNNTVQYPPAKFNISYLIQLEARRNFDKWFVFINPYFQSMINPSVSGEVIRRRYTSWGIQFGIGLNL